MPRIILTQDSGELGNRLVTYSYLMAWAQAHGATLTNLCFWRYAHLFAGRWRWCEPPGLKPSPPARPVCAGWCERLARRMLDHRRLSWLRPRFAFDGEVLCAPATVGVRLLNAAVSRWPRLPARALRLARREECAWGHRCVALASASLAGEPIFAPALLETAAPAVRARFALRPDLRAAVEAWMAPLRRRYEVLIGVHVRRGDYARYRGGEWFFDHEVYAAAMRRLQESYAPLRVGFLLASNEPWAAERWAGLPIHAAPGSPVLDMYSLAECDAIIGPPSTFSGWASFMGQKPICFLERADSLPGREQLRPSWTPRYY